MREFPKKHKGIISKIFSMLVISLISAVAIMAQTASATADLEGSVVDPNGAVVPGATITAKNLANNISRSVTSNSDGEYKIIALPPGNYSVTVEAKNFKKTTISPVTLTVGQSASLTVKLELGNPEVVVNVGGGDADVIETTKTSVASTIDQEKIASLPINERSATGFALTISTVGRDNGRPVGPAPTSGLNIGGQRGRSTLVQVDGADFTDNSINAARSTVSQEAVQEYQVTTNSYLPEFGRATGGIVNVVTKGGGSEFRGNVFGFGRHKTIQARNAFAPVIDGDPNKKPPYTRAQFGFTFGGPVIKDRAFFFFSHEQRRRQESGFFTGDIIQGATASATIPVIAGLNPTAITFTGLTPGQVAYVNGLVAAGGTAVCLARAYAFFASAGQNTALNGGTSLNSPNDGSLCNSAPGQPISPILPGVIGNRFILSGRNVPLTRNANGQYVAFRPLNQLARVFPISEATTYNSLRYDHQIVDGQQFSLRFGYNPSRITGIQDESQNQTLGQNDYSRTGIQRTKDYSIGASLASVLNQNLINEAYFNFGRRDATFDSQVPSVAHQIAGTGFIGSNPFSPVSRKETRFQLRDNLTVISGDHNFKFGGDANWINVNATFELNFPALFNFGQQSCSSLITGCTGPAFTPVQAYGLGFPSVFIQGFGNPASQLRNRPLAFFAQDTWKVSKHLTLNYGIRYDYELTEEYAPTPFKDPLTGITMSANDFQVAQDALGVTQGFPRDSNNWAPRVGFAWDLMGDSKTVIRGAFGMFYDHPLLVVAFNSDIGDGSQQQQSTLLPIGGPSPLGLFNAFQVFHGTLISCNFTGAIPGTNCTPGLASSAQYLDGYQRFNPSTFTGFGPILPFTLHVGKDFQFPYALQGNLSVEKIINKDTTLSASYITVNSRHLAHPQDVNQVNTTALVDNFRRFTANNPQACPVNGVPGPCGPTGRAPANLTEAAFFSLPTASNALYTVVVPGLIAVNNTTGQRIVSPIAANYFRKLGPNYFFIASATGGAVNKATWDTLSAGSLRTTGPIYPYADVNAQLSDGNSSYNALNVELKKRFATNFLIGGSYTFSHSIDDSSDLQTLLKPQDNNNFRAERSDSLFDQRHRLVVTALLSTPDAWKSSDSGMKKFFSGITFAPIVEFASGRPFNILAVGDANGDFQSTNERPNVRSDGTLCAAIVDTNCGTFPTSGTLGRNMGITHNYFSVDARLTKKFRFSERFSLDLVGEVFNMFNRFNEAAANSDYKVVNAFGQRAGNGRYFSQSTAAFDPRQFQVGFKFNF